MLSNKQMTVMAHAVNDSFGVLAGGAVRSGKDAREQPIVCTLGG